MEWRKQLRIRTNLERRMFGQLNKEFRRFLSATLLTFQQTGFFEKEIGALNLSEGVNAILLSEYKRIFRIEEY